MHILIHYAYDGVKVWMTEVLYSANRLLKKQLKLADNSMLWYTITRDLIENINVATE